MNKYIILDGLEPRGIQEYIARDANNIAGVEEARGIHDFILATKSPI